jgi:replicative DNA helicase
VCNGERDTVTLTLTNGMSLTGTPDHRVLTENGWRELGALDPSDYVAVPRQLIEPLSTSVLDRARARVLGYLLADGSLSSRSAVCFVNKDPVMLAEFEACVRRAFPTVHCSSFTGANGVTTITVGNGKGNGGGPSPLLSWLRDLKLKNPPGSVIGGLKSHEKFVPAAVFEASNEDIGWFVASLWDCDGHVCDRFAHYRTVSRALALDVQRLLHRLGFDATIYAQDVDTTDHPNYSSVAYQVTVFDGARFAAMVAPHMASTAKRDALFVAEPRGTTLDRSHVVERIKERSALPTRTIAASFGIARSHLMPYAAREHPVCSSRPWLRPSTSSAWTTSAACSM